MYNAYDAWGTAIIEYKHIPFDYRLYWTCKPKYIKHKEFELILKQLTALSAMRDTVILQKYRYNTKEINRILGSRKLEKLELLATPDAIWFHKI